MTEFDAKSMAKHAAGLFAELKPEQARLIMEMVLPYDVVTVRTALKNHRLGRGFFDFPAFSDALKAENARSRLRVEKFTNESIHAWIQRTAPSGSVDPQPFNRICDHFRAAWAAVAGPADDGAKQAIRRLIRGDAIRAFGQIDFTPAEAAEMADEMVGLQPGERIPDVPLFQSPTRPVRHDPTRQIERVAVLERDAQREQRLLPRNPNPETRAPTVVAEQTL